MEEASGSNRAVPAVPEQKKSKAKKTKLHKRGLSKKFNRYNEGQTDREKAKLRLVNQQISATIEDVGKKMIEQLDEEAAKHSRGEQTLAKGMFEQMNSHHDDINDVSVAKGDFRNTVQLANVLTRQAELSSSAVRTISHTNVSRGLKRKFYNKNEIEPSEVEPRIDQPLSIDWKKLGKECSVYFRAPPRLHFMVGRLGRPDDVPKPKKTRVVYEREKKEIGDIRQAVSTHQKENFASKLSLEMKEVCWKVQKDGKPPAAAGMVEEGRDWLRLLVCKDPEHGFCQTVENMFCSAGLMAKGHMDVALGSNSEIAHEKRETHGLEKLPGLPSFKMNEGATVSQDEPTSSTECVVTLDMDTWRRLSDAIPEESWMPTRDYSGSEWPLV
mgnify:FL=1|jgi:hypothetical protein